MASYRNVDDALRRGELWRAKEILRGREMCIGKDSDGNSVQLSADSRG
jgi:hypothetical protein